VGSALGAAALAWFFFTPHFWLWAGVEKSATKLLSQQPELNRAHFVLQQVQDPWQRIDDPSNRVIEWRLFWPIVAHYTWMPDKVLLAIPMLGCLLALGVVGSLVWRATADPWAVAGAALLAATSSWFFVSTGWLGYFDSWLMVGLLLASFAESRSILIATALVTPWIDERFLLALPLCLAVRALGADGRPPRDGRAWRGDAVALAAGIVPYVAVRLGAEIFHVRETSAAYLKIRGFSTIPLDRMASGLWQGVRLGWICLVVGLPLAFRPGLRAGWLNVALALGLSAGLAVNVIVADDFSRSVSVVLPALVAGLVLAWKKWPVQARAALPWICAGNLLLPAKHVISLYDEPLYYFYAEWEHYEHKPDIANPLINNNQGQVAYQAQHYVEALNYFEAALQYDPDFPEALANRGTLLYQTGHHPEGLADLDRALKAKPDLFEPHFFRARVRQRDGDLAGALADVRAAITQAPVDWPSRAEADQLERTLIPAAPLEQDKNGKAAYLAGRYPEALNDFDAALLADPGFAEARANRGTLLYQTGKHEEGLADLDRALREKPELPEPHLFRAKIRQREKDYAAALDDVREALRQAPADWPGRAEAEQLLRTLVPAASLAANNRGQAAYLAKNYDEAMAGFEAALQLDPTFAEARANRGILYYQMGKHAEGIADLNQALQAKPGLFESRFFRAKIRESQHDAVGALEDLRVALSLAPATWASRAEAEALVKSLSTPQPTK